MATAFRGLALALWVLPSGAAAADAFLDAATPEIERLIHDQLWGHYDVVSLSVLNAAEPSAERPHFGGRYALRQVTASFLAVRNEHWSDGLNRVVVEKVCDQAAQLFLLCRPPGYRFTGTLEADLAFTVDGWKVLSRHRASLMAYPLAGYLRCEPAAPEADATGDEGVLRRCFGVDAGAAPLRAGIDPDDPLKLAVAFTNRGATPLAAAVVERGCRYEIDGTPAQREALLALSCLGGCPEVAPGATLSFSFPLAELRLDRPARPLVAPGSHQVVVRCGDLAATAWVRFPT